MLYCTEVTGTSLKKSSVSFLLYSIFVLPVDKRLIKAISPPITVLDSRFWHVNARPVGRPPLLQTDLPQREAEIHCDSNQPCGADMQSMQSTCLSSVVLHHVCQGAAGTVATPISRGNRPQELDRSRVTKLDEARRSRVEEKNAPVPLRCLRRSVT